MVAITNRLTESSIAYWSRVSLAGTLFANREATAAEWYRMLDLYYQSNGLYDAAMEAAYTSSIWMEDVRPLRNPGHRVVEFYVAKIWPGDIGDDIRVKPENDNDAIGDAIYQVWDWSNWGARKQVYSRWLSLYGDSFLKVVSDQEPKVYFQNIKPHFVTDFDADDRDYLQFIRLDIPQARRDGDGKVTRYWHTELWDKRNQVYKVWETSKGAAVGLDQLGTPKKQMDFSEMGIDFIPVVWAKFQDVGDARGVGCFVHALDKIDEANRAATRLHQLLWRYNKATFAIFANDKDPAGRPLPAPTIDGLEPGETVDLSGEEVLYFPGMSRMEQLTPNINYASALEVLRDQLSELERDLPELAYYRLRDMGQLSGRAILLMLSDAVDKINDARASATTALIRADKIALTIGKNLGIFDESLGNYENGDFDHQIILRDPIPLSIDEQLEIIKSGVEAGIPLETMARRVGWSEEEIDELLQDVQEAQLRQADLATAYLEQARRDFNAQ